MATATPTPPTLISPLPPGVEGRFTSSYGPRTNPVTKQYQSLHNGQDIAVPSGTPLHAVAAGTITTSTFTDVSGNYIKIDHGGGWSTAYLHLSDRRAAVGQQVKQGEVIGLSGSTGRSTGPHLHFIVYYNGQAVDPKPLVQWDQRAPGGALPTISTLSGGWKGIGLAALLAGLVVAGAVAWKRRAGQAVSA